MINFNNFSPNMLKTFDECGQKFFYRYIQKLSVPQRSTVFEKGKKVHALANYYLNGENVDKMENSLNIDESEAWEALKSSEYFKLKVVNTEYNLSCKVGKYWVGGRLDAFMTDGETIKDSNPWNYFILDYKTGNIPKDAERDFQTIVYLLCADKFLSKKGAYKSLKFVYIGLKNSVEQEILLNEDLKKQYEQRIVSTCDKINFAVSSNNFVKELGKCKNCEYKQLCNGE